MYNWLKFIHVASVIVWLGGMVTLLLVSRRLSKLPDRAAMRAFGQESGSLSMKLFGPAALVALITGIGMVHAGQIGFFHLWILWGIVGTILSFIIGGVMTGGTARKLAARIAKGDIDDAGIATMQNRMYVTAFMNVLLLFTVVAVMVFKIS